MPADQLYVVTHGEFKPWAESRFQDILDAFPEPKDPELATRPFDHFRPLLAALNPEGKPWLKSSFQSVKAG